MPISFMIDTGATYVSVGDAFAREAGLLGKNFLRRFAASQSAGIMRLKPNQP